MKFMVKKNNYDGRANIETIVNLNVDITLLLKNSYTSLYCNCNKPIIEIIFTVATRRLKKNTCFDILSTIQSPPNPQWADILPSSHPEDDILFHSWSKCFLLPLIYSDLLLTYTERPRADYRSKMHRNNLLQKKERKNIELQILVWKCFRT